MLFSILYNLKKNKDKPPKEHLNEIINDNEEKEIKEEQNNKNESKNININDLIEKKYENIKNDLLNKKEEIYKHKEQKQQKQNKDKIIDDLIDIVDNGKENSTKNQLKNTENIGKLSGFKKLRAEYKKQRFQNNRFMYIVTIFTLLFIGYRAMVLDLKQESYILSGKMEQSTYDTNTYVFVPDCFKIDIFDLDDNLKNKKIGDYIYYDTKNNKYNDKIGIKLRILNINDYFFETEIENLAEWKIDEKIWIFMVYQRIKMSML